VRFRSKAVVAGGEEAAGAKLLQLPAEHRPRYYVAVGRQK
jgi:hypothetical protein